MATRSSVWPRLPTRATSRADAPLVGKNRSGFNITLRLLAQLGTGPAALRGFLALAVVSLARLCFRADIRFTTLSPGGNHLAPLFFDVSRPSSSPSNAPA